MLTGCDCGDIRVYDVQRSYTQPTVSLNVHQSCHGVSWCPYNSSLLAVSTESSISVYDTRFYGAEKAYFELERTRKSYGGESQAVLFCWDFDHQSSSPVILVENHGYAGA